MVHVLLCWIASPVWAVVQAEVEHYDEIIANSSLFFFGFLVFGFFFFSFLRCTACAAQV